MEPNTEQKVVQKIGKYEIVSELGQGGMGVVYKARDPFIGRMVALKTITPELVSDPEILKRFYREAQSAGTLQHPNIVTIYDLGEADGRPYIAMEFVEGESLQKIIERRARIPLAAKLKLVQQFCEGLSHAHKHGFVHRDVKPANILVTNDGSVKVVDFGIVHLETTNLTKTGMFLGTIHYASPEQINDGRVDSRSDLWSVACVAYEFIAGKKAFDGSNIAAIIAKVLSSEPEALSQICPGVPIELDAVISKGLKKSIEDRYQSLDEMLGDLLPIARGMQQSFIGDLLHDAKDLRDKGDLSAAQEKVRAVLILDNTHGEAKRMQSEIAAELQRLTPVLKAKKLVTQAEQAFSRGEYAEAMKILGEAQALNPADTQSRGLIEKVRREQNRVQDLREAFNNSERAMKQGDLTTAEQELHRVLQLDQSNSQAAQLLEKIREDRLAREREFRLKEALWETDNLVSGGKYEEAQHRLLELQQEFPHADEVQMKLQILDPFIRARRLYQEGEQAFNQGEYAEAVRVLNEAIELNPRDNQPRELKERAVQERDRLRQVREAVTSGQRAMRQGDMSGAQAELQRALQLDPTNTQATNLIGEIRQAQAAREREAQFRAALQSVDGLISSGKLDDAQRAILELQKEYPDSTEIDQKLVALDQQMKLSSLLASGQQAFNQGEFGEAVRILNEAQELSPADQRIRDLKAQAVKERDRLRQVREAISAAQRCQRQGDDAGAEREFKKALQLDPGNGQATTLLNQLLKDRETREQQARLKEALNQTEKLVSRKKFDEAQRKLTELQKAYPDAEEVQHKLALLHQKRAEAAPPPPPPAERAPQASGSYAEGANSMQLAEELRRSLQAPRGPEQTGNLATPDSATAYSQGPAIGGEDSPEAHGATFMMSSLNAQAHTEQRTVQVPSPQTGGVAPIPRTEPRKPATMAAPARVTTAAPKKMSPMILGAVAVVLLVMAVGGFLIFHGHQQSGTGSNQTGTQVVTQNNQQPQGPSEADLFNQAKAAQDAKKYDDAIALYTKVADLSGPMKDQALQSIAIVKQLQQGTDLAKVEKDTYQQAMRALQKKQYAQAQTLFNQVLSFKVPDSTLAAQAQTQLDQLAPILKDKAAFDAAEQAANRNDLDGAISHFDQIANGGGPYASQAKARSTELQKMKAEAVANAAVKQQYDAAMQAENAGHLEDALSKFQAVAGQGGTFGAEAKKQVQAITEKLNAAAGKQKFDAAVAAENAGQMDSALSQFNGLLSNADYKDQAQTHIQQIKEKQNAATDQRTYEDAVNKQKNGDLQGALAEFKSLAGKSGLKQADALNQVIAVSQAIADANKPKVVENPKPAPGPTGPPPGAATITPKATLNYSGDCTPWARSVQPGMTLPDYNLDGCPIKALNLSIPPVSGAPPNTFVLIKIDINSDGSVTPGIVLQDNGMGPQVKDAARSWKFSPITAKGKPVKTSIAVKVTF